MKSKTAYLADREPDPRLNKRREKLGILHGVSVEREIVSERQYGIMGG